MNPVKAVPNSLYRFSIDNLKNFSIGIIFDHLPTNDPWLPEIVDLFGGMYFYFDENSKISVSGSNVLCHYGQFNHPYHPDSQHVITIKYNWKETILELWLAVNSYTLGPFPMRILQKIKKRDVGCILFQSYGDHQFNHLKPSLKSLSLDVIRSLVKEKNLKIKKNRSGLPTFVRKKIMKTPYFKKKYYLCKGLKNFALSDNSHWHLYSNDLDGGLLFNILTNNRIVSYQ